MTETDVETAAMSRSVSIVIPVRNDSISLRVLLASCRRKFGDVEIVVADGESDDDPRPVCDAFGASYVRSRPGRGVQMNAGAAEAKGDILWFLHADSDPDRRGIDAIRSAIDRGFDGGAFRFSLAGDRWYKPLLDFFVGIRSTVLRLPYGDQAFFVLRARFEEIGGFPRWPVLEDIDFYRRLKRSGAAVILSLPVGVSPRRWESEGLLRTTWRNFLIMAAFHLGVPPDRLKR